MQLPPIHFLSFYLPFHTSPTCLSVPYLCTFHLYYGLGYVAPAAATHFLGVRILITLSFSTPPQTLLCNCTVIPVPLSTGPSLNEIILLQIKIVFFLVPNIYVSGRKLFLLRATEELAPTVWSVATPIGKTAHYSSWGGFSLV